MVFAIGSKHFILAIFLIVIKLGYLEGLEYRLKSDCEIIGDIKSLSLILFYGLNQEQR